MRHCLPASGETRFVNARGDVKMMLYLIPRDPYNLFCHRNTDMTHDNH